MLETQLGNREARQQLGFFSLVKRALIRQGRPKAAPRLLEGRALECSLAGKDQVTDQFPVVRERSRLDQMVSDLSCALVDETGIEPPDRVGDSDVHLLFARTRRAGQQRLTH